MTMKLLIGVFLLCNVVLLDNHVYCAVIKDLYRLDIVHYNDFHDRFEETTVNYPVCTTNDTQCLGGFARLYGEIKALLREKPGALLLNAGDTFQGTYWYTLLKWNVTQTFINMLPNDAHAIGNHEFDDGIAGLAPYLAALRAPVVAANIDTSKEPALEGLYKPHVIVERKGRKIGIIGLITVDTKSSSNSERVVFLDPIPTVKKEAELLTNQGVDIIIVLSHCGLDIDMEMAKEVGDNIDIIVGGHTHSLLWNGESPSNETISGPYPVLVETDNKPGHKVLVVTASAFSKYLGNLTTYFDHNGELQSFEGEPVFLDRSISEDPDMKALLQPYTDKLHAKVNEVVGYTNGDLDATQCGSGECAIGDILADSLVDITRQKINTTLPIISLSLRSMIRGSIQQGNITLGDIINTSPFGNWVVTTILRGKYIVEALEAFLTNYWTKDPFTSPWIPHVSGLKLTMNTTSGRAVSVMVNEDDEFKPMEPEREYQVAVKRFLMKAEVPYTMLTYGRNTTKLGVDADILKDYIKKISPITPTLDNRLTMLS